MEDVDVCCAWFLLLVRYWNFAMSRSCKNSGSCRSKPVFESSDCVENNLCRSESDVTVSRLWLYTFVALLMSPDGIFSLCLALRLLHSSHLLNRKCLCSSEGMCLLIPQLQPLWFGAMCPNALLLPCRALQPQKCLKIWNINLFSTAVVAILTKEPLISHISCYSVLTLCAKKKQSGITALNFADLLQSISYLNF